MPTKIIDLEARIRTLNSVLSNRAQREIVDQTFLGSEGNGTAALAVLKERLPAAALQKVTLAQSLAELTDDNVSIVKRLAEQPDVKSLREVALRFNVESLAELIKPNDVPAGMAGIAPHEKVRNFATLLHNKLFAGETSAVLQRMVQDAEIPIADMTLRSGVASFLDNQPEFNIRTTSVYAALKHPEAFKNIPDDHRAGVVEELKTLQRVQAISPVPEAVPALMKANLTSAFRVAEMPESTFLRAYGGMLGEETARQIYTNAINSHIRNQHALTTIRETMRGTGLAIMDGKQSREERIAALQKLTDDKAVPLNLETLFGSLDYCECDDCLSVYSPAAYFVELLQFLRNNNLDRTNPNTGQKGIANTPLEKLLRRRPDLGCLELTCENTFTVLPYIDLVNEVMESFLVHLGNYHTDSNVPKQATLETFNVDGEASSELLAIPQHVNYEAYCILKDAVYPFTLPYHQPIDATRIFLDYLGTSRWELLDTFRTPDEACSTSTLTEAELQELRLLHQIVIDRAVDADFLGMTQEEYIILTHEAFWPKRYFDITQQTTHGDDEYRQKIGVKPVHEYYGYAAEADMLNFDEALDTGQKGLTFVKKQFLPRTGLQYTDLVELLKTRFINPNFPQGMGLTLLESIRFSYRFLQKLVDPSSPDPRIRFAKLIAFLETWQPLVPLINAMLHPDPCKQQKMGWCIETNDFQNWVYCYFDRIGKLIVLESGEGTQLPIEGQLFTEVDLEKSLFVGILQKDGTVFGTDGQTVIGQVDITGIVLGLDGKPIVDKFDETRLIVAPGPTGDPVGFIDNTGALLAKDGKTRLTWLPARDTCDLEKIRLSHLDGTSVTVDEYDRIQGFIRLWRKIGWTIDETDKTLAGLASGEVSAEGGGTYPDTEVCAYVGFDAFIDTCLPKDGNGGTCQDGSWGGCPDIVQIDYTITPVFLHQLRAVKKLLDQTGLPLPELLAFWADVGTAGDDSLYSKLFLTHNLLAVDKVFQADANGNYLTQSAKISDHIPVLMAALRLKANDITGIMTLGHLADALTVSSVSWLYRFNLLAKLLHVRAPLLPDVIDIFGNPFKSAWDTLALLETWGKMEDAGFTFRQLDYLILDRDDALRPLAPSKKTILQLTKILYDGLNAIDQDHPDVQHKEDATSELVRAKAGLLFEQQSVEQILGLLEGTTVYTTNAPASQLITVPASLTGKFKYSTQADANPATATIQVTGILTDLEKSDAKGLSSQADWPKAIDRVGKQASKLFDDTLFGIFSDTGGAKASLLAGDFNNPSDPQDVANTAPDKRLYFLQSFLPFLRQRLSRQLIVDNLSGAAGLESDVTNVLLSEILRAGMPTQPAMAVLENLKNKPQDGPAGWNGYLIPSADGAYTFVGIGDTQPAPVSIAGQLVSFPHQQDDPSNVWSSDPVKLKAGTLYRLQVTDRPADQLQWKTATSPRAPIPNSALLPDYSSQSTADVFTRLYKAALLVNGFTLSADEASYWQNHAADFGDFDFNAVNLEHWKRLEAYTDLRNNLPRTETSLLDLFKWAGQPDNAAQLSEKITAVTTWIKENVDELLAPEHFDLNRPEAFRNEVNLAKLRKATIEADKIGVEIARLFDWAKPGSKFWACHQIAEDIRKATRARFDEDVWEQVVKPLNDKLREHQKQALISYLLVQPDLIDWDVVDADSLFEFFLIDVQMDACMETSRIKQAISSVQLFIQRCLLGLEEKQLNGTEVGVPNDALDRDRWDWMQRYRVWEANRKVFLYPENWIVPELRDDKSPFYQELESELLQKDINTQTVEDALKSYLIKVDEVANLKVVGLFLQQDKDQTGIDVPIRLHVFASTRNAPYFFYYRYFQVDEKNWYPWEKVQVDIRSYNVEANGQITGHGAYVIPVVLNGRPIIFLPEFQGKTESNAVTNGKTFQQIGNTQTPENTKPKEFWEIKLAWSEYRNGKWTQKQQSTKGIYTIPSSSLLPGLNIYEFIPRVVSTSDSEVVIDCYPNLSGATGPISSLGSFHFQGSEIRTSGPFVTNDPTSRPTDFHYVSQSDHATLYSLQATNNDPPPLPLFEKQPSFNTYESRATIQYDAIASMNPGAGAVELDFDHPFIGDLLGQMATGRLGDLFRYYVTYFNSTIDLDKKADVYGTYIGNGGLSFHELKRAYSLYNWEAAFHAPMLLVDRLLKAQQFEQALQMCHYVLNPFAAGTDGKRFWQFPPFIWTDAENVLQTLFLSLQPGQAEPHINEWRNKPFQPHVVARGRPAAYMMWVAITYIKILIAWGDNLFRQDTIETINQATQLYVLAAHVYGPRGQKIPKRGKVLPETYNSLLDKWDAFGNAILELELAFPFSNQTPLPIGTSNGVVGLANIFGFATTLYFGIPDNPELTALRDTIDDRLFKIRNCENIAGVFQQLPLFEPPIDPALLVQAAAQGLSLSSVLNDLNSPMPNYRFYYLLQKALEVCNELKTLGNAFLSAKEKGDGEALSRLRATHESTVQNLVMEVKKQQLDEAGKSLEALQQSRRGPVYRLQHHLKLIGEDLAKVPDENTDFGELQDQIEPPVDESGLKLIPYEKEEMDKAGDAMGEQKTIGKIETLASILHIVPNVEVKAQPFGVGLGSLILGGTMLGNAAQSFARYKQINASDLGSQSSHASRKSGFLRQLQDRVLQANIAGYEIKNIDRQALAQQIRIDIANQEIITQQKQIDNAQEVGNFLRNKYTNQELYTWMEGQVRTLYHQAYTLAYDLAKRAEKVFRFERGLTTSNFIQFGYWDPGYDGLFAGERMYIGLKQLEAAYQETRGYDFEIVKNISLQQLNPLQLVQLRETGRCEFALPEVLFDMGYPGHYMRRIKTVALTLACHVGPPTSMNCVLRLLEHKYRTSAIVTGKNDYPERTDGTDDRFNTVNVPITSIAVSTGQNDSGLFELNFHDERYIPFEGAGVISKWRIELPETFREFDYDSITDVVMHVRYTALDGGNKLREAAETSVRDYVKSVEELSRDEGLFAFFDLPHDFPNEWYKASHPPAGAMERIVALDNLLERLPIFTKGTSPTKILATDAYIFTSANLPSTAMPTLNGVQFSAGASVGAMKSFVAKDIGPLTAWQLKIGDVTTAVDQVWLVARYTLAN